MKKIILFFLIALLFFSCFTPKTKNNTYAKLSNQETLEWIKNNIDRVLVKNTFNAPNGLQMPYRFFSPENKQLKKIPLVIFLHGRGDRGSDNGPQLYNNSGIFMNEMSLVAPNMQAHFPCYVLIPQCSAVTENEEWAKWIGNTPETPFKGLGIDGSYKMNDEPSASGAAALALIEQTIKNPNIDSDRVYIIGKSMGGFGTWEFTSRRPELFAAAIPMAGFSDPEQLSRIKNIPYWIFHGDRDEYNPVAGSRKMYELLKAVGADVRYTEYAGANHGESFTRAFNQPELIPWLFSKNRKKNHNLAP